MVRHSNIKKKRINLFKLALTWEKYYDFLHFFSLRYAPKHNIYKIKYSISYLNNNNFTTFVPDMKTQRVQYVNYDIARLCDKNCQCTYINRFL